MLGFESNFNYFISLVLVYRYLQWKYFIYPEAIPIYRAFGFHLIVSYSFQNASIQYFKIILEKLILFYHTQVFEKSKLCTFVYTIQYSWCTFGLGIQNINPAIVGTIGQCIFCCHFVFMPHWLTTYSDVYTVTTSNPLLCISFFLF